MSYVHVWIICAGVVYVINTFSGCIIMFSRMARIVCQSIMFAVSIRVHTNMFRGLGERVDCNINQFFVCYNHA